MILSYCQRNNSISAFVSVLIKNEETEVNMCHCISSGRLQIDSALYQHLNFFLTSLKKNQIPLKFTRKLILARYWGLNQLNKLARNLDSGSSLMMTAFILQLNNKNE